MSNWATGAVVDEALCVVVLDVLNPGAGTNLSGVLVEPDGSVAVVLSVGGRDGAKLTDAQDAGV